jgi:uncharacterized protein (UPF0332 family)
MCCGGITLDVETVRWCLRQKKGIRIIEPNENLARAYVQKARSALNTMNATLKIREAEWATATAYYARYFALYALLMRMGVKSEIHECTIAVAGLLAEKGIVKKGMVEEVSRSKQSRIETQYYVAGERSQREIEKDAESARRFVLEAEKALEDMVLEQIEDVRASLTELLKSPRKKERRPFKEST